MTLTFRGLILLCFIAASNTASALESDYLPGDLRARVEQLKVDVATIPTTQTNVHARAELSWQWINAFALDGRYVPVNATQIVARVLAVEAVPPGGVGALDATIEEFIFLDDNPGALGTLTATTGPFVAGSHGTISQTYTVGKHDIQTGGGFLVARHFMANFGIWQATDPAAANYLSISSSNTRVSFVATTSPLSGMHGGFRSARASLVFKVASGTLAEGDTVTLVYGDISGGSPGMVMPSISSDAMPLPLYLALADRAPYLSLPIQPVVITGGIIDGVAAFAPSVLRPGEPFKLSVRGRDKYFNRATGRVPNWQVTKNGEPWLNIPSNGAITVTQTSIAQPGTYYLTVTSEDGTFVGESNPILVTAEDRDRIYWGDTHGHSGFAEGIGTPERFMVWARDDARLDFVTHSEHDIWLDDAEWRVLQDNIRTFSEEGEFIAYLGYEWTVNNIRGGHHNVLFRTPDNRNRIPAQHYSTLSSLYQGLRSTADPQDVVVIPHAHQAGDYRLNDPQLEPLIEIMSQHGNFEWFGRMYLKQGHQVGFTAASDNHLSQPGYSAPLGGSLSQRGGLGAVLAPNRTTDDIFDGMKQLKAYATTGDRMIIDFQVNDTSMGQRGPMATTRKISAEIIGTAPIDTVSLVRNDEVIWEQSYLDAENDRLNKQDTFLLTFSSASNPYHKHDNPRGWRAWEGTLEIENATLEDIESVDASFPMQTVSRSEESANRVTFATKTRGDTSSYKVTLSGISRNTKMNFDLVETRETGGAPPVFRPPQRIPADSFSLSVKDLEQGQISHGQMVDEYLDTTTLRRIVDNGTKTVSFEYEDSQDKQGDYYFIRVVQANDAIGWSSPVWIGGFNKK